VGGEEVDGKIVGAYMGASVEGKVGEKVGLYDGNAVGA
jgi:hypothetical protein